MAGAYRTRVNPASINNDFLDANQTIIYHLKEALVAISRNILLLEKLGSRPGSVNAYPRPNGRSPGHNWVRYEDGKRLESYIPQAQVGIYDAECASGAKIKRLKMRSSAIQEQMFLLKQVEGSNND